MEDHNRKPLIYVHIPGEKTEFRDRIVPYLIHPEKPKTKSADWFNTVLGKAAAKVIKKPFTAYDLRRSFALLLDNAGIPGNRQRLYMGHSPATQTEEYGVHDVRNYIMQDQRKVMAYLKQAKDMYEWHQIEDEYVDLEDKMQITIGNVETIEELYS